MEVKKKYFCKVCKSYFKSKNYPYNCYLCKSLAWDVGFNIRCKGCNNLVFIPHIHHMDGVHSNNVKDNRIGLCYSCHAFIHRGAKILGAHSPGRSNKYGVSFKDYNWISQSVIIKLNYFRKLINRKPIYTKMMNWSK